MSINNVKSDIVRIFILKGICIFNHYHKMEYYAGR